MKSNNNRTSSTAILSNLHEEVKENNQKSNVNIYLSFLLE